MILLLILAGAAFAQDYKRNDIVLICNESPIQTYTLDGKEKGIIDSGDVEFLSIIVGIDRSKNRVLIRYTKDRILDWIDFDLIKVKQGYVAPTKTQKQTYQALIKTYESTYRRTYRTPSYPYRSMYHLGRAIGTMRCYTRSTRRYR